MGWTRRSAAISVLLVFEEQRKRAGERVVALREGKNWSQEDLAAKSGLSVKTISRFENGRHEGRNETVRKLAKAFRINEVDITGPPPAPLGLGGQPEIESVNSTDVLADRLDALEARVTEQLEEHARRVEMLLAAQDALLQRQSEILERIENAIAREDGVRDEIAELIDRAGREIVQGAPQAAVRDRQPAPPLQGDAAN